MWTWVEQVRKGVVVAGVLLALAGCGEEEGLPYTSQEMQDAELDCDNEFLRDALIGTTTRQEARDAIRRSFTADNTECLREKLPELSDEQIDNFSDTIEEARDAEFESE